MDYPTFFHTATDHPPYGWQERLAADEACQSRLIDIPTGLGPSRLAYLEMLLRAADCRASKEGGTR